MYDSTIAPAGAQPPSIHLPCPGSGSLTDGIRRSQHQAINDLSIAMAFLEYVPRCVTLDADLTIERDESLDRLKRVATWIQHLDFDPPN